MSKTEKENTLTAFPSVEPKDHHSVFGIFNGPSGQYVYINGTGIFHKKLNAGYWEPIPVPEGVNYLVQVKEDDKNNLYIATPFGVYHTANKGKAGTGFLTWICPQCDRISGQADRKRHQRRVFVIRWG
ncbi:MAG: hypothetical protein IPN79_06190 [Saprospiraceae bacterium]|nr:hypothetical protein [Saprospiraceae bacterium]